MLGQARYIHQACLALLCTAARRYMYNTVTNFMRTASVHVYLQQFYSQNILYQVRFSSFRAVSVSHQLIQLRIVATEYWISFVTLSAAVCVATSCHGALKLVVCAASADGLSSERNLFTFTWFFLRGTITGSGVSLEIQLPNILVARAPSRIRDGIVPPRNYLFRSLFSAWFADATQSANASMVAESAYLDVPSAWRINYNCNDNKL